ncbi:hypothetical protein [Buttiauxella noackiae]|uniref:hypothetical protein n=1 Tax=Buttiauxella noackiae TaxID=82992 RepID=UPI0005543768|nr:hypothetical protein [Buttiauxella noackiae]
MLSAKKISFVLHALALSLGLLAASAFAKTYDWPLPENTTLTVNIPRGALLIVTRVDGKQQVSLDLKKVNIARESSLTSRKITGDIPSEEPLWSIKGSSATLTFPTPADIDLQKVTGVSAALILPATGEYEINGTLSDVYLKDTKNTLRVKVVNGKVIAQNAAAGDVAIDVLNGSITTEGMKGKLSLKLRSGTLTDKGSQGDLDVDLVNGDLLLNSASKTLHIKQITGKQTIDAQACEVFTNDLQTGSSEIRLGSKLKKGSIVSAGGEITTLVADDWQGKIVAEGVSGNNIINHLSDLKPTAVKPPLSDERLELTQGAAPAAQLTLSTVGGGVTLQHALQAGK